MITVEQRIEMLSEQLATAGWFKGRDIRAALKAVPRHLFVPTVAWASPRGQGRRIDRDGDPAAWWDAAYADDPVVIQLDDGATEPRTGEGEHTSSCSAPSTVVALLELLEPEPGHRILEIGTGTGWTAGLLSYLAGEENVTSIEIDPEVAARAAENLKDAGFSPRPLVTDGAEGWPEGAPYDRFHVTCAVQRIPYEWVRQTRPGGVIVVPHKPGIGYGHELRLTVLPDGTALGAFAGYASYMMFRSQRQADWEAREYDVHHSTTKVDPRSIAFAPPGADLVMSAMLPGVHSQGSEEKGRYTLWLWSSTGPWAIATYEHGRDEYEVRQAGDRRLWDEAVAAYFRWVTWRRPDRDRFGMTITSDAQRIWLDEPDNEII